MTRRHGCTPERRLGRHHTSVTLPCGKLFTTLSATLGAALLTACGTPPAESPPALPEAPPQVVQPEASSVDRTKLPEPGPAPHWAPPEVAEIKLKSGATLWYVKQGSTPLVSVQLVLPSGASADPSGREGLTQLTVDMLDEGAGALDALALSEALQRLATDYGGRTGTDNIELGMSLLAEHFDASMQLLADIVMRPKLTAKDFARRRAELITELVANERHSDTGRIAVTRRVLFGKGYGSYAPSGDRQSIARIQLADVARQHRALFAPEGATFIVVGGLDQAAAQAGIERAFEGWSGAPRATTRALEPKGGAGGVHLVNYPDATQSAIAVAVRGPSHGGDAYFAEETFNWTLGGAFTSRLNMNLREDKGYTYGARSTFNRWKQSGFYWLSAKVKSETTRASIDEMLKEIEEVCAARPISEKEQREAVQGMLLGLPGDFEGVSDTAMQLSAAKLAGRGAGWFGEWITGVEQVKLEQTRAAASRYCDPKQYIIVVAGDQSSVEPTLSGLGELKRYDVLGQPAR